MVERFAHKQADSRAQAQSKTEQWNRQTYKAANLLITVNRLTVQGVTEGVPLEGRGGGTGCLQWLLRSQPTQTLDQVPKEYHSSKFALSHFNIFTYAVPFNRNILLFLCLANSSSLSSLGSVKPFPTPMLLLNASMWSLKVERA